jgi:N-terminal acetyltransferase B complex non-catalytic subunit
METYPRLSIKQIQNDTLAHNIFCRISTLHPFQVVGINHLEKGDRDPSLGLLKALMVYEKSATQVPDLAKMALEKGSFNQVEGFLEFADKVRNSICKAMWTVERRRIARLVRTKTSSLDGPELDHLCMESLLTLTFPELSRSIPPSPKDTWNAAHTSDTTL